MAIRNIITQEDPALYKTCRPVTEDVYKRQLIAVLEMLAGKRVSRLPKKHSDIQL